MVEAEEVLAVTEVVASGVVEVSVGETVVEDSEVATRWEEGWLHFFVFAAVVWLCDQKMA